MSATCHEEGIVSGIGPGGYVRVTVERGEACGRCEARGACNALGGQTRDLVVVVENKVGAAEGDVVRLSMEETAVMKASAILYLIPAVGIIGGAAAGYALAGSMGWGPDAPSAVGCFLGLFLGLALSWLIGRRTAVKKAFLPRLTAVTRKAGSGGGE